MRITHIVDSLFLGGLEKLVVNLATIQRREGHEVNVICLSRGDVELVSELRGAGIDVVELNKRPGFNVAVLRKVITICRRRRSEVIHTHNPVANFYGAIGGRLGGVGSIITTRHGMGNFPFDKKREYMFRLSSFFTDKIVFVCNTAKDNFIKLRLADPKKSRVIYNGIHLEKFSGIDQEDTVRLREELKIESEENVVGSVGRLNPVKDISTLINAAQRVLSIKANTKFLIVGDGPDYARLQSLRNELGLSKNILFLGKRHDVARLLSIMDIFVLPSISEGMSLTLIEAMAAGKAVVATRVGGNSEVVACWKTGVLIPSRDAGQLASALIGLIDDRSGRLRMGCEGRKRASELFALKIMADNYFTVYSEKMADRN